jgi:spermidine synthase
VTARRDPVFPLVLLCFFLSGFAGLLFETLWTRQFALVFGTSELAVAAVLAAYMGGLALGAALARRWVLRAARPVLVYGFLELGVGLGALAVPAAIGATRALCIALFGGQPAPPDGSGVALTLFTLLSSAAILLVPTAFMGATLPLLTRFAVRSDAEIGERVALLYAVNTAGAVLGTLSAAFLLLPRASLWQTTWVGVALNALVFALAARAARRAGPAVPAPAAAAPAPPGGETWVLPLVLLAGVCSFSYEVLWTRLLSHLLGGTIYAFGTMLASFLTGIALGSAAAAGRARTREQARLYFPLAQLAVGLTSLAAFLAVDELPALALAWGAGAGAGMLRDAALAALVLLPGAFFMGAAFPLAVRILARDDLDASPASARVYAWNTLGAIAGSLGAGFVWIPALGFHGALAAGVALNLLIAAAAAARRGAPRRRALLGCAAAGAALLLALRPGPPWRLLSTSALDLAGGRLETSDPRDVVHFAAGRSSTVLMRRSRHGGYELFTNGLPEAGVRAPGRPLTGDTTSWQSGLPLLARPEARSLLAIGLGGGTMLEAIPDSVRTIDVIELEAEVVEANRRVAASRAHDPLADPRVRVVVNDARGALLLTSRRWDAIVSQPSHPWTAGAAHLFTREFFALVRAHLEPAGVFSQWLATVFVDEALLRSLLATLLDVFPHVRVYWIAREDAIFFLASQEPLDVERSAARALASDPRGRAHLGVQTAEDLAALLAFDGEGAQRLAQGAPLASDSRNLFQFRAPRILRAPLGRPGFERLIAADDPLTRPDPSWDSARIARLLLDTKQIERAERLAASREDPGERAAIEGLVALARGDRLAGVTRLREAVSRDPANREAWVALTRQIPDGRRIAYAPSARRVETYPELDGVARGFERVAAGDWEGLAALEAELAAVRRGDPLREDALRLRARWRVETDDPAHAEEALALLDELLPMSQFVPDGILRGRALHVLGQTEHALSLLGGVLAALQPSNPHNVLLLDDVELALAEIPAAGAHRDARAQVADALGARRLEFLPGTGPPALLR